MKRAYMLLFTPVFFQMRKNFHHACKCQFFRRYSETRPMFQRKKMFYREERFFDKSKSILAWNISSIFVSLDTIEQN